MGPTDEELVEAFQQGDVSAFEALVHRWDRKIHGAIHRVVGADNEASDLCQEAFLKAYRGLGSFKKEARFSSWLYQIALNVCRDRLRRRRGRTQVSLDDFDGAPLPFFARPSPSPLDLVQSRDLSRLVESAMASLGPDEREVIILKEYQGLTFPEIAEALELPLSTVKTRLYRGLGQLRLRLERQGIRGVAEVTASLP